MLKFMFFFLNLFINYNDCHTNKYFLLHVWNPINNLSFFLFFFLHMPNKLLKFTIQNSLHFVKLSIVNLFTRELDDILPSFILVVDNSLQKYYRITLKF